MAIKIPESLKKVLEDKAYGHVVTFNAQGNPEITMVWLDVEGDELLFNTAEGRRKWRNLKNDPRVSISISKQDEPYQNWSIQGKVVDMRTSDGVEVIDALARKYLDGVDKYPWLKPGMVRVTIVVEPVRIAGNR